MNRIIHTSAKAISLILFSGIFTANAYSQQSERQVFKTCDIATKNENWQLHFSVCNELNIRYYLIEAGGDTTEMDIIARIPAKSNSVLPQQYPYGLNADTHPYYRVRSVAMNNDIAYSDILREQNVIPQQSEQLQRPATGTNNYVAMDK